MLGTLFQRINLNFKPIRFGYKNWVICSDDGCAYNFIPYQGKSRSNHEGPLSSRVVEELLDVISDDVNYHDVYFGNFFTSLPLLEESRMQGICATGTVRTDRLFGAPLPPPKEMQKEEGGIIEVYSASNVYVVQWMDNNAVILASHNQTHNPLNTCKRYNRTKKSQLDVNEPYLICKYNVHMGGVYQLNGF